MGKGSMSARVEVDEARRKTPVVAESDVIVVGGGPAGVAAAVAAARNGATVTLVERYNHLGGLASGGMVLVLDDMTNGQEITVAGIAQEYVDRLGRLGLAVFPPAEDRRRSPETWNRWRRWGLFDFHAGGTPKPVTYAVAFDPDGWKRVSDDLIQDANVNLRLHSWFSAPIIEDQRMRGVICETKSGREAILGDIVIDTTGDIDVAARAGSPHVTSGYITTLVFRLGGVDCDSAERFETQHPRDASAVNREAKRVLGGAWGQWWLRTPLPGVVWCNCPHLTGFDGTKVADLTLIEFEARKRIDALVGFARGKLPGFEGCYVIDVAAQTGVRQTRLLQGEYVVTKDDVHDRRHFPDSVARGRDYYTPYRALLPRGVEQLLVAGRHYSATPAAQRISREIPPCIAMGEAAGTAAAIALGSNLSVRNVDVRALQRQLRAQGADPGDVPSANATIDMPVTMQADRQGEAPESPVELYRGGLENGEQEMTALPLEGIRIIDFTQVMMGPCATQLLGDFGADVIKIERPHSGDLSRHDYPGQGGLDNPVYLSLNRNKRSLEIDLRTELGKEVVYRLLESADVVVNNFRPGVMDRMGLGFERLHTVYPRLIYAAGTGFGSTGPYSHKGGQDNLAQAYTGVMQRRADPDLPLSIYGTTIADYSAGMHLVQGILLALLARERTGEGQRVEVSLYDSLISAQMQEATAALMQGDDLNWAAIPLSGVFQTRDGAIVVVRAFKDNPLRHLCAALGLPDISNEPEFATLDQQQVNKDKLHAIIRQRLAEDTTSHWIKQLESYDVLCAPVRSLTDALRDPQTLHNDMIVEFDHPTAGAVRTIGQPVHLSGTPARVRQPAPRLGEHTEQVLRECGLDSAAIEELKAAQVIS